MSDDCIWCDITELLHNPIRTGVQRVAREVLSHWQGASALRLCRFDAVINNLVEVPDAALMYLVGTEPEISGMSVDEVASALALIAAWDVAVEVPLGARLLVTEVFFDEARCRHHVWREEDAPGRLRMLMFDFIPWLAPDLIGVDRGGALMWYIRLAQLVTRPAFISSKTADDWAERIVRDVGRDRTVLPLGADGLNVTRQTFSPSRRVFVALGSIDGRKNQLSIVDAFLRLWEEGFDFGLTLVGRVFDQERSAGTRLRALVLAQPLFRLVEDATDQEVSLILEHARATIYASTMEGYGLPPVESIAAGIPCLVDRQVPSVATLAGGVVELASPTAESIYAAVTTMIDDDLAERVWQETATIMLPTWQDLGRAVAEWVDTSGRSGNDA